MKDFLTKKGFERLQYMYELHKKKYLKELVSNAKNSD